MTQRLHKWRTVSTQATAVTHNTPAVYLSIKSYNLYTYKKTDLYLDTLSV